MALNRKVFSVFVASPSDVTDERDRLEEVINEINKTWSRNLDVQLDLVRWETHTRPGFGEDGQDVINQQIPDDYDLFIGIMWCRCGTTTDRAMSGTIEEYERAKARYDADSKSVSLMWYFKDAPIEPSRLDASQLKKVADFKQKIREDGGLYHEFSSIDQFSQLIRMHLCSQVQQWLKETAIIGQHKKIAENKLPAIIIPTDNRGSIDDEEEGVIDLIEIFEDRIAKMTEILERIEQGTEELGKKLEVRTSEVNEARIKGGGVLATNIAKRLIAKAASDMDEYVARMEVEIPPFREAAAEGMNAFVKRDF